MLTYQVIKDSFQDVKKHMFIGSMLYMVLSIFAFSAFIGYLVLRFLAGTLRIRKALQSPDFEE